MTPRFIPMVDIFDYSETYNFIKFNNADEFKKELLNYDYVVILNSNDYFKKHYSGLFKDAINNWTLYKVQKNENELYLTKI